jgi:hypothetical protein
MLVAQLYNLGKWHKNRERADCKSGFRKIQKEICASCLKQWGQAYPSKWTKNPITPEYESKYSNKKHVYLFLIAIFAI